MPSDIPIIMVPRYTPLDIDETWRALLEVGQAETRTDDIANTLRKDEIITVLATAEFFNASDAFIAQLRSDLGWARYRVFDAIATNIDSLRNYPDNFDVQSSKWALQVIAHSYLKAKGDIDKFIDDLRVTDYDINKEYERINLNPKGARK